LSSEQKQFFNGVQRQSLVPQVRQQSRRNQHHVRQTKCPTKMTPIPRWRSMHYEQP
jgi:hypothetical protein